MAETTNPLSEEQITNLRNALTQADNTLLEIARAKRAGLDVQVHEDEVKAQKEQIKKILSVYG